MNDHSTLCPPPPHPRPAQYARSVQQLAIRALNVSNSAPLEISPAHQFVTVDAQMVREIRLIAETMGIDWRDLHAQARR